MATKAPTPFQMIGGMIKKGVQKIGAPLVRVIKKDEEIKKAKDEKDRANAPVGAEGGTNTGEYKGPQSFKYGIQKRKIT